ncbi:MAG: YgeY family selenium metabolism-linked hydrolase [Fusobacteriaceae bacterium]|jgi:putative selenium metabolism hydrolase|nr:YgeY family selenium metabolism-linked hydrolase [Fusobacteriaceae bacterium]
MLTEARKSQLLEVLGNLIARRSYSGEEKDVAQYIEKTAKELGYDAVRIDRYGSVICTIKGKRPGLKVLMDGHIDTVPADAEKWTKKPFEGAVADGKFYGRGATDMKGAVGAMLLAGAWLAQDSDKNFAGEINLAGVVHEECFEGVAAREISKTVQPDVVIIGEASQGNLKIGQRGRAEIVLETFGVPAHSANPEKGVNAVYKIMNIISAVRELPMSHHDILGDGILELTDVKSSPYPGTSVVPDYCRATYDRRLLVGETPEEVIAPIQQLLKKLSAEDPQLKAEVSYAKGVENCWTGEKIEGERFFPGWLFSENEAYIQKALHALQEIGQTPTITHYNFCTNGSHYAGEAGIKTIGYGPSRENLAHTIDEYAELESLYDVAEGYYAILKAYLSE